LKGNRVHIQVYEHQTIRLHQEFDTEQGPVVFDEQMLKNFVDFFGEGIPYYSLIRNGLQFNEYVGAIQIGATLVSVLPKAQKRQQDSLAEKSKWNQVLIDMLRVVNGFEIKAPSSSSLKLKNNAVLDLYFELFVKEVEYLLHRGLVKKYRKKSGNLTALKGRLLFSEQINKNITHKERFYTAHTTYDTEHLLHFILFEALQVLMIVNTNSILTSRINSLRLNFPEMQRVKLNALSFDKVTFNRKTEAYKKAIQIARLIILNYHPDLRKGNKEVLALMFDMNKLWEQFVLASLRKSKDFKISGLNKKYFWKPKGGARRIVKPDIAIKRGEENFILDTKWKLIETKPSIQDVRQMYVYHHYFKARKVALFYPGESHYVSGNFMQIQNENQISNLECGLLFSQYHDSKTNKPSVKAWQDRIISDVENWMMT
jgi:5-methylcytosine-specific restriction enzyme subunit McrC